MLPREDYTHHGPRYYTHHDPRYCTPMVLGTVPTMVPGVYTHHGTGSLYPPRDVQGVLYPPRDVQGVLYPPGT